MSKDHEEDNVERYLDKSLMKFICRMLYFVGLGDCWYEPMNRLKIQILLYRFWCLVSGFYLTSVLVSELLAYAREDMTVQEKNDCMLFSIAHPTIMSKFVIFYFKRPEIRVFLKKLIEDTRISLTKVIEAAAVKKSKMTIFLLFVCCYTTLILNTVDALKRHIQLGVPMRTIVVYWPRAEHHGLFVDISGILTQLFWWYMVLIMLLVDGLCITSLTCLGFKFRTLQLYFRSLREDLEKNPEGKSKSQLEEDYERAFIFGINLHSETLNCVKDLQSALGTIYSVQIVESIGLLSMSLIKLVRLERSLTFLLANSAFITGMVCLTGVYNLISGDVTHEASLVSDAMFDSGWELCHTSAKVRPLVVMAIQASQVPVIMTAFGIFGLSYANFISVLRSSYSFFAVMY